MRYSRFLAGTALAASVALISAGCSTPAGNGGGDGQEQVTIEFSQWWEGELGDGVLQGMIDDFESENPNVKVVLVSNPYGATIDLQIANAATGTLSDVVAINGSSVYDLYALGALADMEPLMGETGFTLDQLAAYQPVGEGVRMLNALNFVYPLFMNDVLLAQADADVPSTQAEFSQATAAVSDLAPNVYGWSLPINVESPAGYDTQAWLWASGGRLFAEDGAPNVNTPETRATFEFLYDEFSNQRITPGAFTQKEQDKVEEFSAGRTAFMVGSLAHVHGIRQNNPALEFSITPMPTVDGYRGGPVMATSAWALGVAESSEHKEAAWALVEYLLSKGINEQLASLALGFPNNVDAVPSFVEDDPIFARAFEIYSESTVINEFDGRRNAMDLRRTFNDQLARYLSGDQDVDTTLDNIQARWVETLG